MAAQKAITAQRSGDNRLAAAEYLEALRRFSAALGEQDGLTMHALARLAWNLGALGEHAESERLYRRLLKLQTVKHVEAQDIASTHVRIGFAVYQQGRFEEAEVEYLRALRLPQTPSDLEAAIQGVAAARLARGMAREAEPFFLRLLVTEGYKSDGRWTVLQLGAHYLAQSDRRACGKLAEKELELLQATRVSVDPDLALALINLAEMRRSRGERDEARKLLVRARRILRALGRADDPLFPVVSDRLKRLTQVT